MSGRWHTRHKRWARKKIFARDGHRCVFCGSDENLTLDHIKPRAAGGGHALQNLQTLCVGCNNLKSKDELIYRKAVRFEKRLKA